MADVELGYISGVFGVSGEVRVFLHNPDSELLAAGCDVQLVAPDGTRRTARLTCRSGAGRRILGQVSGVVDPQAARALKDWRIVVAEAELPATPDDEYYVRDVEGAEVWLDGDRVGTLRRVHASGPVDVLEIDLGGPEAAFVPSLQEFVEVIEPGRVVLRLGALDA